MHSSAAVIILTSGLWPVFPSISPAVILCYIQRHMVLIKNSVQCWLSDCEDKCLKGIWTSDSHRQWCHSAGSSGHSRRLKFQVCLFLQFYAISSIIVGKINSLIVTVSKTVLVFLMFSLQSNHMVRDCTKILEGEGMAIYFSYLLFLRRTW